MHMQKNYSQSWQQRTLWWASFSFRVSNATLHRCERPQRPGKPRAPPGHIQKRRHRRRWIEIHECVFSFFFFSSWPRTTHRFIPKFCSSQHFKIFFEGECNPGESHRTGFFLIQQMFVLFIYPVVNLFIQLDPTQPTVHRWLDSFVADR